MADRVLAHHSPPYRDPQAHDIKLNLNHFTIAMTQYFASPRWILQSAYSELTAVRGAVAVTLNLNTNQTSSLRPREIIGAYFEAVDTVLLGRRYYRAPLNKRLRGYLVPEMFDVHPHLHGVLAPPDSDSLWPGDPTWFLEQVWRFQWPQGTVHVVPLYTPVRWAGYNSKENSLQMLQGFYTWDFCTGKSYR